MTNRASGQRRAASALIAVAGTLLLLTGAAPAARAQATGEPQKLRAIADEVYAWRLEREPLMRLAKGMPVTSLPRIDAAAARDAATFARAMGSRLDALNPKALSHADDLFRLSIAQSLRTVADEERFRRLVFLVTPYQGGDIHQMVSRVLSAQKVTTAAEGESYLRLVADYARLLDDIRAHTEEQRAAGILLPKPAIPKAQELCDQLRTSVGRSVELSPQRLASLAPADAEGVRGRVTELVNRELLPRVDRLRAVFDAAYIAKAPQQVGLAQYPEGLEFYRHLIRAYTGLDLAPDEIHTIGTTALAQINAQLESIRAQTGFKGTRAAFQADLKSGRWIARTPAEVEARYMGYIRQIEPHIAQYFSRLPKASYGVKRLDVAVEPGMTYGYYQPPNPSDLTGYYRYNGSGLDKRTLVTAQHLIYHELIPGHHFQIALERENTDVHPLRAFVSSTAYVEGWAEYAAQLAEEMKLYEPLDRYGHLMMRSFTATRLVVDSGLNAKGWSLDKGRDAMREGTLEADAQIATELLRYSTDIPGQALAYYLGYDKMRQLRERAERSLGDRFDLRAFNDSLLSTGQVPLNVLEAHVDWFIEQGGRGDIDAIAGAAGTVSDGKPQHIAALNSTKVTIASPVSKTWTALLDRTRWMPAFVSKQVISGSPSATGEVSIATFKGGADGTSARLEEILLAVPQQRLVIRLAPKVGSATVAVGEYRLTALSKRSTQVEFTAVWWEDIPPPVTAQRAGELKAQYAAGAQSKIESDLQLLKKYLESSGEAAH